jgi:nucleoside-diphosphate-sugar epimerase
MRVFVTGSSGHLAQALLPELCARPEVDCVVGLDLNPAVFFHPKFIPHIADMRGERLAALMRACDALVHLAFVVLRGRMNAHEMRDINVRGTQHVFGTAAALGVRRLIHLSSAAVYGQGERVVETAPMQPLPGFLYGEHKAEVETWMDSALPQALRLRPHVILGPHCQPLLKSILRLPFYVSLPEPQPRLQCVHEEDVAGAIVAGLFSDARGPLNLAAPGEYSVRDVICGRHRFAWALPFAAAKGALWAAWRLASFGGEPAWLDGIHASLTLDCTRAARELGWAPRRDVRQTLAAMIAP